MQRQLIAALAVAAATAACSNHTVPEPQGPLPAPAPDAAVVPEDDNLIPLGAHLLVELNETLTTDMERGTLFTATVKEPLVARTGGVVVPEGAVVTGLVTATQDPDGLDEPGIIRLNITRITFQGATHPIAADIIDTDVDLEDRNWEDVAEKAGIGAAAGAVLGAVIGGDLEAAIVGGAVGAGAGTIVSLGFGERGALPQGTDLTLRTTVAVDVGR